MPTPEELLLWSNADICKQIQVLLEPNWAFDYAFDNSGGVWVARVVVKASADDDTEEKTLWEGNEPDERLVLFDAYGWLWLKTQTRPAKDSPWHRTRELTRESVSKYINSKIPDPEDVQPDEVQAVYEEHQHRHRKDN